MSSNRVPLWLKLAWTAWMVVWVPVYWWQHGPANFLWLCDVANFAITAALWLESPRLFSSQAVGVLVIQIVWAADFLGRAVFGVHPLGGTEYMFDAAQPLPLRALSLFHLLVPMLLYPLLLYLPTHAVLGWWARRTGRMLPPTG